MAEPSIVRHSDERGRSKKVTRRAFLSCGCLGCAGVMLSPVAAWYDATRIEPNWPEVNRYEVGFPDYPLKETPIRIAQLSDLHRGPYISEEHLLKFVNLCNEQQPDLVVITGDFVSTEKEYAASCAKVLQSLEAPMGVFGVMGNHDYWSDGKADVFKTLKDGGVHMIKNGNVKLKNYVWLIGVDDFITGRPDIQKAFRGVPEKAARIVITHTPKIFPKINNMNVFVMVGHTHGGQYNIPFVPRKYLPGLLGWDYIKGWYAEGNSRMYVNRGIGMVIPPIRFFCRPEITVFTCGPEKPA